ncbi:MAG: hypothetical protein C5B55_14385 [Blastocatellia bacterium]|nr:MAG: hypothetical protein C5B55_14385 [Blastocatellia bacterium]
MTLENGQKVELGLKPPAAEYEVLKEEWQRQLNSGAIPIEEAMKKVTETLPTRSKEGSTNLVDYAVQVPTAASSGRETEKRVQ